MTDKRLTYAIVGNKVETRIARGVTVLYMDTSGSDPMATAYEPLC